MDLPFLAGSATGETGFTIAGCRILIRVGEGSLFFSPIFGRFTRVAHDIDKMQPTCPRIDYLRYTE